jgi:3-hydroxyacyl-CoA dehydrogenase
MSGEERDAALGRLTLTTELEDLADCDLVIEAVLETYRQQRQAGETFIATLRRVGMEPYKDAAKAARLPASV